MNNQFRYRWYTFVFILLSLSPAFGDCPNKELICTVNRGGTLIAKRDPVIQIGQCYNWQKVACLPCNNADFDAAAAQCKRLYGRDAGIADKLLLLRPGQPIE